VEGDCAADFSENILEERVGDQSETIGFVHLE
jgi:hypothetical protein